jgi:hypothetical protein
MSVRMMATVVVCAFVLSACGGGGGSSPAPRAATAQQSGSVVLVIPTASTTAASRSPKYISPSALSIAIAVSGGATIVADISVSSPDCTTTQTGRSCTIPLSAPAGHDTFTFTQYAGANATGAVLGTGTAALTVVAGTPFVLSATLNGSVGSIALALGTIPPAGTPGSTTLTVTAEDPAGNVIVGPGDYTSPITLAVTDSTGQTTLSSSTVTGPASSVVTVNYAGGAGTNATITASTTGAAPASVAFAPSGCSFTALSNGGFTNGYACWVQYTIATGSFPGYPHYDLATTGPCLASTTNQFASLDVPLGANATINQTFIVPTGTPTLYMYTWGNLDPVTVTVSVQYADANAVVVGTFTPPPLQASDSTCVPGAVPVIESFNLTQFAGLGVTLTIGATSTGYDGTFANFDDIGFTQPPPTY